MSWCPHRRGIVHVYLWRLYCGAYAGVRLLLCCALRDAAWPRVAAGGVARVGVVSTLCLLIQCCV